MDHKKDSEEADLKKHGLMHEDKAETLQKQAGPRPAAKAEDPQAASRLAAEPGATMAERARKAAILQKKVGNTRLAHMLSAEHPPQVARIAKEEKGREQDNTPSAKADAAKTDSARAGSTAEPEKKKNT